MYLGFNKVVKKENTEVFHLTFAGGLTSCGIPVDKSFSEVDSEEGLRVCRNCRSTVLKRTRTNKGK